jgi:hypothetical protein
MLIAFYFRHKIDCVPGRITLDGECANSGDWRAVFVVDHGANNRAVAHDANTTPHYFNGPNIPTSHPIFGRAASELAARTQSFRHAGTILFEPCRMSRIHADAVAALRVVADAVGLPPETKPSRSPSLSNREPRTSTLQAS